MVLTTRSGTGFALSFVWVWGCCSCAAEADIHAADSAGMHEGPRDAAASDADAPRPSSPRPLEPSTPDPAGETDASVVVDDVEGPQREGGLDAGVPHPIDLPTHDAAVAEWLLIRPEVDSSDDLLEPFGAADGVSYEESTCTRENAECLRPEAREEWLDLAETLGAEATARAGYLTALSVPAEASERYYAWLADAVGDLPPLADAADEMVANQALLRVVRALLDRWPVALHKTSAEFDTEVTVSHTSYSVGNTELHSMYDQRIDGIETTGYYLGYGEIAFDDEWRLSKFVLPTPSAPLRAWVERHGPLPTLDEARLSAVEQLRERYPSDYDPDDFGTNLAPDVIDYSEVEIRGPYWYWGDERWTYDRDFEYWRVVYTVVVYFNCEDYLFTKLQPFTQRADAGPFAEEWCRDGPGEE